MLWSLLCHPEDIALSFESRHLDQAIARQLLIANLAHSSPDNLDETHNWVGIHFDINKKDVGLCQQLQLHLNSSAHVSSVIGEIYIIPTGEFARYLLVSFHKDGAKWKVGPVVVNIPDIETLEQFHELSESEQMKLLGL